MPPPPIGPDGHRPMARVVSRAAIVIAACGAVIASVAPGAPDAASDPPSAPPPKQVVATTGMAADLAAQVLGRQATVRALMGPGVDPHLYKPTRDDVARIMAADLVVVNGLKLEGKMGDVLARAGRDRWVVPLGELLPPERVLHPEPGGDHPDPHIWLDPELWATIAVRFGDAVAAHEAAGGGTRPPSGGGSEREPQPIATTGVDAEAIRERAAAYASELRALDAWARAAIATIPEPQRVLITSHDAFTYLGRAYGLRVEGVQGISTDSEPGLRRIRDLVDLIVAQRVPAVFVESSVPRKSIEALIEGAGARGHTVVVGGELFSDALGPAGSWEGTVPGMIDHNVTTIVRALGGSAAPGGWKARLTGAASGSAPSAPPAPTAPPAPPAPGSTP